MEECSVSSGEAKKPIQKKVLHAGSGPEPDCRNGAKLRFHFVAKSGDKVLDDSRKWDKPVEIIVGKKFKMEAWEMCLTTMRLKEVASFTVSPVYSAPYPMVAKTLRDAFGKDKAADKNGGKRRHHHVCGMMAMQMEGGITGYEDLNLLVEEPRELEFVMELLSVEAPDEYEKESWQMDADEKLASVTSLRLRGNELYRNQDLQEAAAKYAEAIGRLDQLMLREKPHDEEWNQLKSMKVPLLLNYSQCKLSSGEFYPTIEHCTEALEIQPDNIKALFRRAKAHVGAWNLEEARLDFERVMNLDASLKGACQKELKTVAEIKSKKDQEDKAKFENMF